MTDRPAVLSAKVDRLVRVISDGNDLKSRPKSERPNEASLDSVRAAHRDSVSEITGPKGSVAEVERVELPSERLKNNA